METTAQDRLPATRAGVLWQAWRRRGGPPRFRLGYRPALDGLRALAVLAVIMHHTPLRDYAGGGFLGVDVFFVLSGFLITALLVEEHDSEGTIRLVYFYLRRALRLLPALFVLLGFCCLLALGCRSPARAQSIYRPVLLTACYCANWYWYFGMQLGLLAHTWSLGVEEQFYLVWPFLLCLLLRAPRRALPPLLVGGIAASALLRAGMWQGPLTPSHHPATTSLATRADALLAGCLLAVCACRGWLPRRRVVGVLAVLSAALLGWCLVSVREGDVWLYRGGFTAVAAASALCVAALVQAPSGFGARLLSAGPLVWVGRRSYGIYLWHFPLLGLVPGWLSKLPPRCRPGAGFTWAVQLGLTLAVAALSFYLVEERVRRWGRRWSSPAALRNASSGTPPAVSPQRSARHVA